MSTRPLSETTHQGDWMSCIVMPRDYLKQDK